MMLRGVVYLLTHPDITNQFSTYGPGWPGQKGPHVQFEKKKSFDSIIFTKRYLKLGRVNITRFDEVMIRR